jgi:hypothetical protein
VQNRLIGTPYATIPDIGPPNADSAISHIPSRTEQRARSATRSRTLRVDSQKGGSTDDVDCVVPGQYSRPVPTRTCVAGDGGVRSSGEKPKGPRSIRGPQVLSFATENSMREFILV